MFAPNPLRSKCQIFGQILKYTLSLWHLCFMWWRVTLRLKLPKTTKCRHCKGDHVWFKIALAGTSRWAGSKNSGYVVFYNNFLNEKRSYILALDPSLQAELISSFAEQWSFHLRKRHQRITCTRNLSRNHIISHSKRYSMNF